MKKEKRLKLKELMDAVMVESQEHFRLFSPEGRSESEVTVSISRIAAPNWRAITAEGLPKWFRVKAEVQAHGYVAAEGESFRRALEELLLRVRRGG